MINCRFLAAAAVWGVAASACFAQNRLTAICPWTFDQGTKTSRETLIEAVRKVAEHKGYTVLPQERVDRSFEALVPAVAYRRGFPVVEDLERFAHSVNAEHLIFGKATWHTRSIWVGTGPKTISTATVDVYVFNVGAGRVTFQARGVEGRSDEKESTLKDIADVLVTPIITAVSGGPATPREQRAAEIAVGRAMRPWVMRRER